MVLQSNRDDLSRIVPFNGLPEASCAEILTEAQRLSLAAGDCAISEDEPGTRAVFVILSGCIKLVALDQQMTVRYLRAGTLFGHFTVLRDLSPPYRAESVESSEVLRIPKRTLDHLFNKHPVFAAWFRADVRRFERELGAFDDVAGSRFLFGQRLRDLEHTVPPLTCSSTVAIREAARSMFEQKCDHMIVTEGGRSVGLLTKSDICDRAVATGLNVETPVSKVMTKDLLTIRARASVFDGMMAMETRGWRHLILLDPNDDVQGVISDTDLARTLLANPAALRQRILQAESGKDLNRLRKRADQAIVTLYRRAVRGEDILKINTRFNDDLAVQAIRLAQQELLAPPASLRWCWLSLGSEGRGEMGLRTDQDNAIIYWCDEPAAADAWLRDVAMKCNELLAAAGIALCDGGIMAGNAQMRHTLDGWNTVIDTWMGDPDDTRLLWIAALSDCRPIFGDENLCTQLKLVLAEAIGRRPGFLRVLARESVAAPLPLRKFPSKRLQGSGSGRDASLQIKRQGSQLITNAARLFCLDAGWLEQTNTGDRLTYLAENNPDLRATALEAIVAADVLTELRLNWHVEQVDRNEDLSDNMPLSQLGDTRKRLLIGAYETVDDIRFRIRNHFGISR